MLMTQTPGGLYERFFEEVGRPVQGEAGPPDPSGTARRGEYRRHGGQVRHRDTAP